MTFFAVTALLVSLSGELPQPVPTLGPSSTYVVMARKRSNNKWDESKVARDENGRFVAWSMYIEGGGQKIERSGPDLPRRVPQPAPDVNPYTNQPYPRGMTPSHQRLIDMKRQWDRQMYENQQNNTISPTQFSSRRTRKPRIA